MSDQLLGKGNTVAAVDELYLFLTNMTAIEYIRNGMKRVRKKESSFILASQNIEDFLLPEIKEFTKPLFSIPAHHFLFNPGNISPTAFIDTLQLEESEYSLIKYPERGTCLYRCGNERYLLQVIAPQYKAVLFETVVVGNVRNSCGSLEKDSYYIFLEGRKQKRGKLFVLIGSHRRRLS